MQRSPLYISQASGASSGFTSIDKIQSLSPHKRTPTHQVKKNSSSKNNSKSRKEEVKSSSSTSNANIPSIQLLKPPIKNNMQSLFQQAPPPLSNSKGKVEMLECNTPSSSAGGYHFTGKDTSYDRS